MGGGWLLIRELLKRSKHRNEKELDDSLHKELGKVWTLNAWSFFALCDDLFEFRNIDRQGVGGDV